jgi:hypothetical protein
VCSSSFILEDKMLEVALTAIVRSSVWNSVVVGVAGRVREDWRGW